MFDRNNTEIAMPRAFNEQCVPVIIVTDRSGSVAGKPIEAQTKTINHFITMTKEAKDVAERIYFSVIGYNNSGSLLQDWTPTSEMASFPTPIASGGTSIINGLALAEQKADQIISYFKTLGVSYYKPQIICVGDWDPTCDSVAKTETYAEYFCKRQRNGDFRLWAGATTNGEMTQEDVEDSNANVGYNRRILAKFTDGGTRVFHIDTNHYYEELYKFINLLSVSIINIGRSAPGERVMPGPPPKLSCPNLESWLND